MSNFCYVFIGGEEHSGSLAASPHENHLFPIGRKAYAADELLQDLFWRPTQHGYLIKDVRLSARELGVIDVAAVRREAVHSQTVFGRWHDLDSALGRDVPDTHAALAVLVEDVRDVLTIGRNLRRGSVADISKLSDLDRLEWRVLLRRKLEEREGSTNRGDDEHGQHNGHAFLVTLDLLRQIFGAGDVRWC